jgi:shikimate dehydrogenase
MSVIAAVLGSPVSHSLSPAIHRAAFEAAARDGDYSAIECQSETLKAVLLSLRDGGAVGASITMPFKEDVIAHLSSLSETAKELNAVNCVVFANGKAVGHNTDGDGCCDALVDQGRVELRGSSVVLLGGGGTARAIALSLLLHGAHVTVVNRTIEKANSMVVSLSSYGRIKVGSVADIADARVLVNATSVGMNSTESPVDVSVLHSDLVVLDAVYSPMETTLLAAARLAGCVVVDGLWMLIHQARHQQILWFGQDPSAEVMRSAAEQELASRRK